MGEDDRKSAPDYFQTLCGMNSQEDNSLWWVIPKVMAGMPMPYLNAERRLNPGSSMDAYADDLISLHRAGIRAIVCLLNIPSDSAIYESAGFAFLCLPVADGDAPTIQTAYEFVRFVNEQRTSQRPVVVHCEAGLGRTGTMLAAYLISEGDTAEAAIARIRALEPTAIETSRQIAFLKEFSAKCAGRGRVAQVKLADIFAGVLIGTAVGDALGLPAENFSPRRIHRLWKGDWRMRFVFGKGMVSDDTEHSLLVAQTLLSEANDPARFQKILASKLRWWFASLPAGVGLATARVCIKLWIGFSSDKAAVRSAGSGPVMRSAIIGSYFAHDSERRRNFVLASSRLTHRSWQAETAAIAVAECAAYAVTNFDRPNSMFIDRVRNLSSEAEWQDGIDQVSRALNERLPVRELAIRLGLENGVTGYSIHVVLMAMYSWLLHWRDVRAALISVLDCGGDTDTAGAIVGAIAGAAVTRSGIPSEWTSHIIEWPRSIALMTAVAERLDQQIQSGAPAGPVRYFWLALPLRNLFFLIIVLVHGFRRTLPPY